MRILIADENPETRRRLAAQLAEAGHGDHIFAEDILATWEVLQSGKADFVVIDWSVAAMADFLLFHKVRRLRDLSEIPLVIAAPPEGELSEAELAKAAKAGADALVRKPVNAAELKRAVADTLAARKGHKPQTDKAPEGEAKDQAEAREIMALKLFFRGYKKLELRKFPAAIMDFAQALKHNPLFPEAMKGIAEAVKGAGDLEKSRHFLFKAAQTYAVMGRDEECAELFHILLKANPETANPFKAAADFFLETGRRQKALDALAKAQRMQPKDVDLAYALARLHLDMGDTVGAEMALAGVIERMGAHPEAAALFEDLTGIHWKEACRKGQQKAPGRTEASATPPAAVETDACEDPPQAAAKGQKPEDMRKNPRRATLFLFVRPAKTREDWPVLDLSAGGLGVGVRRGQGPFATGNELTVDLFSDGKVKAKKLPVIVVRHDKFTAGCRFGELTDKQRQQLAQLLGA